MNSKLVLSTFFLMLSNCMFAQNDFSENPLNAALETKDVTNFWLAFDKMGTSEENPFKDYIKNGTVALKAYPYRVMSADSLFAMVNSKKSEFELGGWSPNKIKMNKKNDFERTITLKIRTPASFKFTKGNWESQAEVSGIEKGNNISLEVLKPHAKIKYQIKSWF
ncbi:hypothetical protein [Chryseobacterium koreense]